MAQAAIDRPLPAAYASFSPRLAPTFLIAGGLLAVAGGLGLWVRVTSVNIAVVTQTASLTGASSATGWFISALGVVAVASSLIHFPSSRWLAAAASAAAVLLSALRIADLSNVASAMAFRAGARAGVTFTAYHAGFGWGAWALTLATVSLSLGVVVSVLRWLDERKGLAS
jgi:hypothetical protein